MALLQQHRLSTWGNTTQVTWVTDYPTLRLFVPLAPRSAISMRVLHAQGVQQCPVLPPLANSPKR